MGIEMDICPPNLIKIG